MFSGCICNALSLYGMEWFYGRDSCIIKASSSCITPNRCLLMWLDILEDHLRKRNKRERGKSILDLNALALAICDVIVTDIAQNLYDLPSVSELY